MIGLCTEVLPVMRHLLGATQIICVDCSYRGMFVHFGVPGEGVSNQFLLFNTNMKKGLV